MLPPTTTPSIFSPPLKSHADEPLPGDASGSDDGRRKRKCRQNIIRSTVSSDPSSAVQGGTQTDDLLGLVDDAVAPCPLRHVDSDTVAFPGLVSLTKAIRESGRYRHRHGHGHGHGRCTPATEYEQNQRLRGAALNGGADLEGLYRRYLLRDYLPSYIQDRTWIPGRRADQLPKQGGDAPMAAAIRRGFQALAYPKKRLLLKEEATPLCDSQGHLPVDLPEQPSRRNLTDLHTIAGTPDRSTQPCHPTPYPNQTTQEDRQQHNHPEPRGGQAQDSHDDSAIDVRSRREGDEDGRGPTQIEQQQQRQKTSEQALNPTRFEPAPEAPRPNGPKRKHRSLADSWVWGPSSTSNDKIEWFARTRRRFDEDDLYNLYLTSSFKKTAWGGGESGRSFLLK